MAIGNEMNHNLEVPTPSPWPGRGVNHKLRGERCLYRSLRWWGLASAQGMPRRGCLLLLWPLERPGQGTERALLQLNGCSLGSPRLSARKETEHLFRAFLGLLCSPTGIMFFPRQAGRSREEKNNSFVVTSGAGDRAGKRKTLSFSCSSL